jgi:hypothetical protein
MLYITEVFLTGDTNACGVVALTGCQDCMKYEQVAAVLARVPTTQVETLKSRE